MKCCRRSPLLLAALLAVLSPRDANAQVVPPAHGQWGRVAVVVGHGLSLSVESGWPDGNGYIPYRLVFAPTVPVAAPRTLRVELEQTAWGMRSLKIVTTAEVVIPSGADPAVLWLLTTAAAIGDAGSLKVFEGRKELPQLAAASLNRLNPGWMIDDLPHLVVIGGGLVPDCTALVDAMPGAQGYSGLAQPPTVPGGAAPPAIFPTLWAVSADAAPESWLAYTSTDLVIVSIAELAGWASASEPRWRALLDWVRSGGTLVVDGFDPQFSQTGHLDALCQASAAEEREADPRPAGLPESWTAPAGWRLPDPAKLDFTVGDDDAQAGLIVSDEEQPRASREELIAGQPHEAAWFVWRELGQGRVLAVEGAAFPGTAPEWAWMFNTVGRQRWENRSRYGVNRNGPNPDFWRQLIPGVGLAPVGGFQLLITLFVVGIGPVNYFLLKRKAKLHLLVVTTPLVALAVSAGLFVYALLADGLGVRVRARSYTQIDQRSGRADCWATLSYYAGSAPAGGLRYADDAAIFSIDPSGSQDPTFAGAGRQIVWQPGRQQWRGWLPARTPIQMLQIRTRATTAGLRVRATPGGEGATVENLLGTRIRGGMVVLADGSLGRLEALEPGAVGPLHPVESAEMERVLRRLADEARGDARPLEPPEADRGLFGFLPGRQYYRGWHNPSEAPSGGGILEQRVRAALRDHPDDAPPEPRSYLVMVDRSGEIDYGLERFEEQSSLHVVAGRW